MHERPMNRFGGWRIARRCGWLTAMAAALALVTASGASAAVGTINEFPVPSFASVPFGIALASDGNMWFTEDAGDQIGRITPAGNVVEYPVPKASGYPLGIAAGSDGNVWFTESTGNQIGRITPSGVITEYPIPTVNSSPSGIVAGPDGNMWFTENSGDKIGKITLSGTVTEYAIPTAGAGPAGITVGPDGNVWFAEQAGNQIGRITPAGTITEYPIPTANSNPFGIAAGPDGNLWFTEGQGNQIGRITPAGTVTEYALPTANGNPSGIAAGPDGNVWFTEVQGNLVGRITAAGTVTVFPLPSGQSGPAGISAGRDGAMWFAQETGKIGRIVASDAPTAVIAAPAAGGVYTTGQSVASSFSCAEGQGGPGLSSCDDSNATDTTGGGAGHLDTATPGAHTYTVTATSKNGLASTTSVAYTVDNPPAAAIHTPSGGGEYTLNQSVPTTFSCVDGAYSPGLRSCADSNATTTSTGGAGHLDTTTPGAHVYTVSATSTDGLTAHTSLSYTVSYPAPAATIVSPASGQVYALHQVVASAFSCAEGPFGPGLASCDDSNGTRTTGGGGGHLPTSTPGRHTYAVTATSEDGRTASISITYTVLVPSVTVQTVRAHVTHGRAAVTLACRRGSGCRGTLALIVRRQIVTTVHHRRRNTTRTMVLARVSFAVTAGRSRAVTVRLTRAAVSLLTRARHHRLSVMARATVSGGRTVQRMITLT